MKNINSESQRSILSPQQESKNVIEQYDKLNNDEKIQNNKIEQDFRKNSLKRFPQNPDRIKIRSKSSLINNQQYTNNKFKIQLEEIQNNQKDDKNLFYTQTNIQKQQEEVKLVHQKIEIQQENQIGQNRRYQGIKHSLKEEIKIKDVNFWKISINDSDDELDNNYDNNEQNFNQFSDSDDKNKLINISPSHQKAQYVTQNRYKQIKKRQIEQQRKYYSTIEPLSNFTFRKQKLIMMVSGMVQKNDKLHFCEYYFDNNELKDLKSEYRNNWQGQGWGARCIICQKTMRFPYYSSIEIDAQQSYVNKPIYYNQYHNILGNCFDKKRYQQQWFCSVVQFWYPKQF
ncbi:hypothetical protein PPERSA_09606 [Pseudocohnilembus persalinus]|uniref:Uncharacterized protein n=1 Tax=Pseudocohnilembus persalinus TaxID=266149 RepID=A0A0V0QFU0_PSEPJ|nr:hypothetical protein PPERSA_09606 [Pseudocohnilembus persalinus]|eukprot:KRX01000.1 hypothetical protein PPERSA_09606 [Pseudocohnilembus persalinus]